MMFFCAAGGPPTTHFAAGALSGGARDASSRMRFNAYGPGRDVRGPAVVSGRLVEIAARGGRLGGGRPLPAVRWPGRSARCGRRG
ncbi:hypothetical protein GCM10009564_49240 [Streptomyces thermogriseus]|uniref:Uncharacterized protein n=1 Tax=Streptomyces thermogriseus TaxID=75292 RepID=A0ABP4DR79_9ACTN